MTDGETIRFGHFVSMVGRDQAPCPGHVIHADARIAGYKFSHVPPDDPRVSVKTSSRSKADNDADGFPLIEIIARRFCRSCDENNEAYDGGDYRPQPLL